jgi:Concanavalin A-like lectin/glucanases superfamily
MSLVFQWDFDDRLTTTIEDPTGGVQLATYGLPPFVAGPPALGADSRAREFNSLPEWQAGLPVQYATSRAAPVGLRAALVADDYTFSCWIRPKYGSDFTTLDLVTFGHADDPDDLAGLYMQDSTRVYWYSAGWNTSTANTNVTLFDEWNHVVARKRGLVCDIWINGAELRVGDQFEPDFAGFQSVAGAFVACDHGISEGITTAVGSNFAGGVADVRLYNEALTDAQIATLFAGGDPLAAAAAENELPDAAADMADELLDLSPVAGVALELGSNLFVGPELATRAEVPDFAVFVMNGGAGAPAPYLNDADDFHRLPVVATVRSSPADYAGAEKLARQLVYELHRSKVDGYVTCLALQSTPSYLGEDEQRRHRFSVAFELWWVG